MINTGYAQHNPDFVFVSGRLNLDFANTQLVDREEKRDLLPNGTAVLRWAQQAALITPAQQDDWLGRLTADKLAELHRDAMALRQTIDEILQLAPETTHEAVTQHLPELNRFLTAGGLQRHIHQQGDKFALDWQIDPDNPTGILTRIALDAAELISEQNWRRIKQCQHPQCILHFFDTSKNASRRWCSMELCGNREKVSRHRRKQSEQH